MRMTESMGSSAAEQLARHGLADDGDFGGAIHIAFVQKASGLDLPVADLLKLRRHALG